MLTELHFKNWRSLRDVTIDNLTPITVFIGANSSGKTNILDGLGFLRDAVDRDIDAALNSRGGESEIRTINADANVPIQLEFSFLPGAGQSELTYKLSLEQATEGYRQIKEVLTDSTGITWMTSANGHVKVRDKNGGEVDTTAQFGLALSALGRTSLYQSVQLTFQFISQRWQLLKENYTPALRMFSGSGETYLPQLELYNIAPVLDSMKEKYPQLYNELQEDLKWLLAHVDAVETETNDRETRVVIREKFYPSQIAPTISAGTARLIGMLVAIYMLDEKLDIAPGLVVIEEPDTAINPLLLRNFVALLRTYVDREGRPRQFILTTHNPRFLDWFEPEEVRIVSRDEQGETHVSHVPSHIRDIWLDDAKLGDAWLARVLDGMPE